MTLYTVSFGSRQYQVNIEGGRATVNGEPVQATFQTLNRDGLHLLQRGYQAMEFHLSLQDEETLQVLVSGHRLVAHITNPFRRKSTRCQDAHSGALVAPMPGLVVQVLVAEGDTVEEGQPLLVIESMKMQMQMRSPSAGKVICLPVVTGQQVDKGQMLAQVE
jgi:biotin carboxyl carrier protein